MKHTLPGDIERTSMEIIGRELEERGISLRPGTEAVVKRVIHATADFEFAQTLQFSEHAVEKGMEALLRGTPIVTDTNMALSGISKKALEQLNTTARCYMADPEVAKIAEREKTTRAVASMKRAAEDVPGAILAVGNAPTALFEICDLMETGLRPALVIAVPVGFVNVTEAKEAVWETCKANNVPVIAAMGRKGGSTVDTAICNALLYSAANMLDPTRRGWLG